MSHRTSNYEHAGESGQSAIKNSSRNTEQNFMFRMLAVNSTAAICLMICSSGYAQVDISTQMLLDSGSSSTSSDEMSIRLVRKKPATKEKPTKLPAKSVKSSNSVEVPVKQSVQVGPNANELDRLIFGKNPPKATTTSTSTSTSTSTTLPVTSTTQTPKAVAKPNPVKILPAPEVPLEQQTPVVPPPVAETIQPEEQSQYSYVEQVHPDDQRLNQLEINVGSGVMATEARSNHSVRDYRIFSPLLQFGAAVWIEPTLGLSGNYLMSLSGDIDGGVGSVDRYTLRQERTELALNFRKFFGLSRKSTSIDYGLKYVESKFDVSSDATTRVKTKTNGIGLHMGARLPSSPTFNWTLGAELYPRLQHVELDTVSTYRSGGSPETSQVRVDFGGEVKLSRNHIMTWSLEWNYEKSRFSGAASEVDPRTGSTPTGVSVESSTTFLNFGYRWGQ